MAATATAKEEGRGRQRASPDHLPVPPRPRSRYRHRAQAVGTPPRPAPGPRHGQAQGTDHRPVLPPRPRVRPCSGSPLSAFLYLCAALGVAVAIRLCPSPPSSHGSPRAFRFLANAFIAALVIILLRRRPPVSPDQDHHDGPNQIPAAPAPRIPAATAPKIQYKQPRPAPAPTLTINGSILQAGQIAAAMRSSMADSTRPTPAVSPPQADSSDSDGGRSSTNGDEINNFWYTPVDLLEAGDVLLVVPEFIHQLQEMSRRSSTEDETLELLRTAFRDANKSNGFYRLSDVVEENRWIIYDDPHSLTDRSTGTSVMTMKITAKLVHLIWFELDGPNRKLWQEVKKECFREVVGQSVEELLDVALSFSNARWSADNPLQMLTIFDALVDVLYIIMELPFSRTEFMHDVVAHVFYKMVVDLRGMIEGAANDMHNRVECAISSVTVLLVRYLEFFYRNGEMMQSVLGTGYCTIELSMIRAWASKLSQDAEVMFRSNGQRYIYMLNNMDYVYQLKYHPGGSLSNVELQRGLCLLIHEYIQRYLDEYWVPLVRHLGVDDSLKSSWGLSLDRFLEEFFAICDRQGTWKVRTMLKDTLRKEMVGLILPNYVNFLQAPQRNPSSRLFKGMCGARPEKPVYTAARLEEVMSGFFER